MASKKARNKKAAAPKKAAAAKNAVAAKKSAAPKKAATKKAAAPTKKAPAPKSSAAGTPEQESSGDARAPRSEARGPELLGEVTAPSGTLAIFDVGLVGYLPREALEPALIKTAVPRDRSLPVIGQRVGKGRFADCWDFVAVRVGDGEITHAKKLGEAGVDFARLICMDHAALDSWQHEDSLDGKADFVFWGRDAAGLARMMRAPATTEGHGWVDLPVADAEAKADQAARIKAENHWLLATDLRPHSHHFHALAAARRSTRGAGTIEVAGTKVCLFFTSWGDGVFPVFLDLDAADRPVQIRVQLSAPPAAA